MNAFVLTVTTILLTLFALLAVSLLRAVLRGRTEETTTTVLAISGGATAIFGGLGAWGLFLVLRHG